MTPRNAFVMRETFASKQALVLRGVSATALRVVMRDSGWNHGCSTVARGPGSARARGRARLWRDADRTEHRVEPCPEHKCFFFQAEDGIRDLAVTGVQTCALPI